MIGLINEIATQSKMLINTHVKLMQYVYMYDTVSCVLKFIVYAGVCTYFVSVLDADFVLHC